MMLDTAAAFIKAGSTALGEQTDPEALRALLGRYFERMRGIVESHGGTVEKFAGDGARRGPGDTERRGQRGPGRRLSGVDQRERGAGQAASVVPCLQRRSVRGLGLFPAVRRARHR